MLHEAAKVLRYPRFRKFHALTEDGIYQYIAFLRHVAEIVTLDPTLTAPIRDVNDIIVAQTAILGEATILCTMDDDFFDPAAREFLARFGITVVSDVDLIHQIRDQSSRLGPSEG